MTWPWSRGTRQTADDYAAYLEHAEVSSGWKEASPVIVEKVIYQDRVVTRTIEVRVPSGSIPERRRPAAGRDGWKAFNE